MTRLRKAAVMFTALLFAGALGVVVGAGPLQKHFETTLQRQVAAVATDAGDRAALRRARRDATRAARFDQGFAQALAPRLLEGQLDGRTVAVLALPGVPERVADAVAGDVEAAGGSVTGSFQVGPSLVDPTGRPLLDELSERLLAELEQAGDEELGDVEASDSTYTRAGLLTARALLTTADDGDEPDEAAVRLYNVLTTAKLLRGPEPDQRAGSAVVLLPPAAQRAVGRGGRAEILTELVGALDDASDGVVVAGHHSAAGRHGLLSAVRHRAPAAEYVSTVDSTGRAGHAVTVLALAEQVEGDTGHYGVGPGAEAMLPEGRLDDPSAE